MTNISNIRIPRTTKHLFLIVYNIDNTINCGTELNKRTWKQEFTKYNIALTCDNIHGKMVLYALDENNYKNNEFVAQNIVISEDI